MGTGATKLPKAREEGLIVQELPDEVLVYDQERHKAHCLNHTAAFIWRHCDGERSVTQLTELLRERINARVDDSLVRFGIEQLDNARLLCGTRNVSAYSRLSRRDAIRKLGLVAVVTLPIITSIVAPRAVEAASCQAMGHPCIKPRDCCSGICDTNGRCA